MNRDEIKVSVCVATYNHEKYIAECLQSLVDQKTNFRFEVIVGEDCSTDSTREIVREFAEKYPDIIVPIYHEENVGGNKNYLATHDAAKGEYIAHMDGDDYALPGKLQAQADFLDDNASCNIVWHRMKIVNKEGEYVSDDLIDLKKLTSPRFFIKDLLMLGAVACHSSKMYRKSVRRTCFLPHRVIDFYFDVLMLETGYGYYFDGFFGAYRIGVGVTTNRELTSGVQLKVLLTLSKKFPKYIKYISAQAIRLLVADIKNGRSFSKSFYVAFKTFHPLGLVYFIKTLSIIVMFKSPIR